MGIDTALRSGVLGEQELRRQEIGELIPSHVFPTAAERLSPRRAGGLPDSYAGVAREDPKDPRKRPSGFDATG